MIFFSFSDYFDFLHSSAEDKGVKSGLPLCPSVGVEDCLFLMQTWWFLCVCVWARQAYKNTLFIGSLPSFYSCRSQSCEKDYICSVSPPETNNGTHSARMIISIFELFILCLVLSFNFWTDFKPNILPCSLSEQSNCKNLGRNTETFNWFLTLIPKYTLSALQDWRKSP